MVQKQIKQKPIHIMDEFYKKYLPNFDKKYPIDMRVSKEEQDLILAHRGGCDVPDRTMD